MDPEAPSNDLAVATSRTVAPTGRDPATGRFAPGWSGRPNGALNHATLFARALLEKEGEHLVETQRRTIETVDFEARIERLEAMEVVEVDDDEGRVVNVRPR